MHALTGKPLLAGSAGAVPCADDEECAVKAAREARSPAPAHFLWTQARLAALFLGDVPGAR